ncbi:MAG: helix-turn-helix domain-containing protein [Candidatus Nanoarchaeia archaeon]|nr:helix-turn-helix domain-containing protein [Candidatus Nanoarchaeia archaeon]
MIVQEEFLKKLRAAFDLNIYEVKIWTALLSRGLAAAGELSDISGVPRSRTYDVLESLEKKGFVIMKLGKPIKYLAVEPEEVVKRVRKVIEVEGEEKIQSLENVKTTNLFKEIKELYSTGINHVDVATLSGAIRGRNNLYGHLDMLLKNAEKSVAVVTTPDGFIRKMPMLDRLAKRNKNLKIRVLTKPSAELKNVMTKLNPNVKVKNASDLNARFIIIDEKEVLFMTADDKLTHESFDNGIWVKTPFFAAALQNLFDLSWEKAK